MSRKQVAPPEIRYSCEDGAALIAALLRKVEDVALHTEWGEARGYYELSATLSRTETARVAAANLGARLANVAVLYGRPGAPSGLRHVRLNVEVSRES